MMIAARSELTASSCFSVANKSEQPFKVTFFVRLLRISIHAGIGGGGILTLSEILIADLVPLAERGVYAGLVALVWAAASVRVVFVAPALSDDLQLIGPAVVRSISP